MKKILGVFAIGAMLFSCGTIISASNEATTNAANSYERDRQVRKMQQRDRDVSHRNTMRAIDDSLRR